MIRWLPPTPICRCGFHYRGYGLCPLCGSRSIIGVVGEYGYYSRGVQGDFEHRHDNGSRAIYIDRGHPR